MPVLAILKGSALFAIIEVSPRFYGHDELHTLINRVFFFGMKKPAFACHVFDSAHAAVSTHRLASPMATQREVKELCDAIMDVVPTGDEYERTRELERRCMEAEADIVNVRESLRRESNLLAQAQLRVVHLEAEVDRWRRAGEAALKLAPQAIEQTKGSDWAMKHNLTPDQEAELERVFNAPSEYGPGLSVGNKIRAIKAMRNMLPGLGLKDAKDAIEARFPC